MSNLSVPETAPPTDDAPTSSTKTNVMDVLENVLKQLLVENVIDVLVGDVMDGRVAVIYLNVHDVYLSLMHRA